MSADGRVTRTPADLRLLPAAMVCWAVGWVAVHLTAGDALRLGGALLGCALLLGGALFWGRARTHRSIAEARVRAAALHLTLSCAVAGAVALSAGLTMHSHGTSGWTDVVESEAPEEIMWRVVEDPRPVSRPDPGGLPRVIVEVQVLQAEGTGAIQAPALVLMTVEEDSVTPASGSAPLRAGHRYRGMMSSSATESGARATALLTPFGEAPYEELAPDRRTAVAEAFAGLREGTREASQAAWGDGAALLPGMVLGDRSLQSLELTGAMEDSGLSHLSAISGTHCSLLLGALLGGARLLRAPRWTTLPLVLGGLTVFVLLVHPTPSVMRAAVMGGLGALAVFSGRGRASSALLCVCVLLLLLHSPWYAVDARFQLSAAATLGIVLAGQRLSEQLGRVLPAVLAAPIALTASAQLFAVPVLLPISGGVNTYAVPANLLAAPLLPFVTVPGTAAALFCGVSPRLAAAVLWTAGLPAAGIGWVGRTVADLPQALAPWPEGRAGGVMAALWLAASLSAVRLLLRGHRSSPAGSAVRPGLPGGSPGRSSGRRPGGGAFRGMRAGTALIHTVVLSAAAGCLAAVVLPAAAPWSSNGAWRVAMCDVGQGDMLVVRTAERSGIVIDAGDDPEAADECLRRLDVEVVPVLMITHEHLDHYGGAPGVARGRELRQILYSASGGWEAAEEVDLGEQDMAGVEVLRAAVGQRGEAGGGFPVRFTVWAADDHHPDANDNSLVVHFELIDPDAHPGTRGSAEDPVRMLTLGDLEEQVTATLLRREELPHHVDLLKVAHHGAQNGGTELIRSRRPAAALIGVGEGNSHGHPHPSILDALEESGTVTYRTDLHGTVLLELSAGRITVTGG